MKRNIISVICFITVLLFTGSKLIAQEHHEESETHGDATEEHGEHHFHKHHVAIFNGATTNLDHEKTSYSVGIDYEFRISKACGVGLAGEMIMAENPEIIAGLPIFMHPCKGGKIIVAPMMLYAEEAAEGEVHGEATTETKAEASFAVRVGVGYDMHFGRFSVGPTVNFDYGKTKALVYGLAIGVGF